MRPRLVERWLRLGALGCVAAAVAVPPDAVCSASASDPMWAGLCAMAAGCGATGAESVFLGRFPKDGGQVVRGIGAARAISQGERFLCLPDECSLTSGSEEVEALWSSVAHNGACDVEMRLAFYIAVERRRGKASRWAALLAALPSEEELRQFHPAFLPEGLLPRLANAPWLHIAQRLRRCYAAWDADDVYEEGEEEDKTMNISFDEAYLGMVYARTYSSPVEDGPADTIAMYPVADLQNTDRPELWNTNWTRGPSGEEVCFVALRDIAAGEELLDDYDVAPNPRLFFSDFAFDLPSLNTSSPAICDGLSAAEFPEPAPDAHPVLLNFWRFAEARCGRRRQATRSDL